MNRIIVANWKMNGSINLIQEFQCLIHRLGTTVVICPPACYLPLCFSIPAMLGAQNCSYEKSGAFTGEISPKQLSELGCKYVILGHSERRSLFNETDTVVNAKAKLAIEHQLTPIICIGETLEERQENRYYQTLMSQLDRSTHDLNPQQFIIAYEPIWSIGSGLTPTVENITEVIQMIQKRMDSNCTVLYGGSVNDQNASTLSCIPTLNGVLVGGASLNVEKLQAIIDAFPPTT
jgi:triosephosphate isomerase